MARRFILNAKNAGTDKAYNTAIAEGYEAGFLKSISLDPLGSAFDDVINNLIPNCEGLGVGIELNLTSGHFLCSDLAQLSEKENYFTLLLKSINPKNKAFTEELEREIRRQIEKVKSKTKISHIDSKRYVHSIPLIFDMVCRLAKEYSIPVVCTHFEYFYFVPDLFRHLRGTYFKNFLKKILLNFLTVFNENTVHKYELETNDYLIGTSYANSMDGMTIFYAIRDFAGKKLTIEADVCPCRYEDGTINENFDEYMLTKNQKLKIKIEKLGYNVTNYVKEEPKEN